MISNKKDLYKLINSILKPSGFTQKGDTWYLNSKDCICFFAVPKSSYGGYFGHVMGCFLRDIYTEQNEFPKYYKHNLIFSLDDLVQKDLVHRVFDLENNNFVNDERETIIKDLIENHVLIFINEIKSKEGIKIAVNKYEGLKYRMDIEIKKVLSIEH